MGGTMQAPLLVALRDEMEGRGWAVLRFNFRGIGASEGRSSTGLDEVADASGALDYVRRRLPQLPVALAGWSFGAAVAVRAAASEPDLAACVAIAPAVTATPDITAGLPSADELRFDVPLLVVCGANDETVSPEKARAWAEAVPGARYVVIPAANHFFWAKYDELNRTIGTWLDSIV
jgi:hypothetical protein